MANIMTVEDEGLVRALIMESLESAGHTVTDAPDGEAALEQIKAGAQVDALITDFRMPKMDGYELALAVRAFRPDMPVVFMTGYSGTKPLSELPRSGVMLKPFNPDTLIALVEKLLAEA